MFNELPLFKRNEMRGVLGKLSTYFAKPMVLGL